MQGYQNKTSRPITGLEALAVSEAQSGVAEAPEGVLRPKMSRKTTVVSMRQPSRG